MARKKKTTEEFREEMVEKYGDEFELLDEYINNCTKIRFRHNPCGRILEIRPAKFLSGDKCKYCSGKAKKNTQIFTKELEEKYGKEYEVLGEYINSRTHIKIRHICGHEYDVTPDNILRGKGCPKCRNTRNTDQFKKDIFERFGGEYEVLSEYEHINKEVKFLHKMCGTEFHREPLVMVKTNIIHCPVCKINRRKTHEEFLEEVYGVYGEEYSVTGEYTTNKSEIEIKHNKCGTIYVANRAEKFLRMEQKCPICYPRVSKYSVTVENYLEQRGIKFIKEYRFEDCVYENTLPFDFFLPDYNICIEVDGEHHFKPVKYWGGEEAFKLTKIRDNIKNTYCQDNKIGLIRLPYYKHKDFKNILDKNIHANTEVTYEVKVS